MKYKSEAKLQQLGALLLATALLCGCQGKAQPVNLQESKVQAPKTPSLTYGIKDNSIYDKPKVVRYNPLTGDKKTIFEPPTPPPPDLESESNGRRGVIADLPKSPLNIRRTGKLADLLGDARSYMFDAQTDNLSKQELEALSLLQKLIAFPLNKSNYEVNFNDNAWLSERLFYEASYKLSKTAVDLESLNTLLREYFADNISFTPTTTNTVHYDSSSSQLQSTADSAQKVSKYLGAALPDIAIQRDGDDIYVKSHTIFYRTLGSLIQDSNLPDTLKNCGIITCGGWLIGYFDNRFPETGIENGGIIFTDYNWLDSSTYYLKYDKEKEQYKISGMAHSLGTLDKSQYKPRICAATALNKVKIKSGSCKLKIGEIYQASALPQKPKYNEQVVARYQNGDSVIYLQLPTGEYALCFDSNDTDAKRPAFIPLSKIN